MHAPWATRACSHVPPHSGGANTPSGHTFGSRTCWRGPTFAWLECRAFQIPTTNRAHIKLVNKQSPAQSTTEPTNSWHLAKPSHQPFSTVKSNGSRGTFLCSQQLDSASAPSWTAGSWRSLVESADPRWRLGPRQSQRELPSGSPPLVDSPRGKCGKTGIKMILAYFTDPHVDPWMDSKENHENHTWSNGIGHPIAVLVSTRL